MYETSILREWESGIMSNNRESLTAKERRERAQGLKSQALQRDLELLDSEVAKWADSFVFGEVWGRSGISHEERMLVAISSLATQGRTAQLRNYLFGAVQDGISPEKVQESLVMLVVYAGFPTALVALNEWREVRLACERKGLAPKRPEQSDFEESE
jgi:4-carboxymuconolactone decarboxylase